MTEKTSQENFQQLKNKIIKDEDKILFDEVIGTFENGFNRACYITSWINIIESLKSKLYELSALDDSRAASAVTLLEDAEKNKHSTDRLIFEQAKSCEIISATDLSTIAYLWEQRCIFAHPYNKSPSKEELKYIINQSVEIVLGKSVNFNKDYIEEFSKNIIQKPHLISNEENKILALSENTLKRIDEKLHPFYFKTLFFQYGENQNIGKENELRKIELIILNLLSETTVALSDSKWGFEQRAIKFPYEFSIGVAGDPIIWTNFDSRIKDILLNYYSSETDYNKTIQLNDLFKNHVINNSLEDSHKLQFFTKLDSLSFVDSIYYYAAPDKQCERIIKELKTWIYAKQEYVTQFINSETGLATLNTFSMDQSFEFGRMLYYSAKNGHWKSAAILNGFYEKKSVLPEKIVAGSVYAHFISFKDELDFSRDKTHMAVKITNDLETALTERIYDKIFAFLDQNKPDENDWLFFGSNTLELLQKRVEQLDINWKSENKDKYEQLIEKTKKYFGQ